SGNVDAVDLLVNRGADVNAMEPVRGLTPAMFAAASNRAAVIEALAARGADLKATTKMVDLNSMGRGSPLFASLLTGNPPPPAQGQEGQGGRGGQGGQGSQGPQGREGRNPFAGRAGIDRQYQLNELVYSQGGLTSLLLATREGHGDAAAALLDSGADVNQ